MEKIFGCRFVVGAIAASEIFLYLVSWNTSALHLQAEPPCIGHGLRHPVHRLLHDLLPVPAIGGVSWDDVAGG